MKVKVTTFREIKEVIEIPDTYANIKWKAEFENPTDEGNEATSAIVKEVSRLINLPFGDEYGAEYIDAISDMNDNPIAEW
jgi:hypothetical protein